MIKFFMAALAILALVGCTQDQANSAQNVTSETKTGIAISDAVLNSVNAIIQAADPNSKVASQIAGATTIANRVNGVTQTISIVIPVTPTAAPATTGTGN
jgi:hypothetical protein